MEEAVKIGKGNNGAKRNPPKKQQSTTRNTGKARGAAGERQKKVGGKGKSGEKLKATFNPEFVDFPGSFLSLHLSCKFKSSIISAICV